MTPREIIAQACFDPGSFVGARYESETTDQWRARAVEHALSAHGYPIVGPDDAKLITTALEHASFALDGIVALDDEDEGKDGGSATAQFTKKTVDRALKAFRALGEKP